MPAASLKTGTWPASDQPDVQDRNAHDLAPPPVSQPAPERLIAEEPVGADRRGPLRPDRLVPSRARLAGQPLALAFRGVDVFMIGGLALFCLELASPLSLLETPFSEAAPLIIASVALLWALGAVKAYGFRARESLARHAGRLAIAFATAAILTSLVGGTVLGIAWVWNVTGVWFAAAAALICAAHALAWLEVARLRKAGRLTSNIVIVGAGKNAERLIDGALAFGDVAILGVFDDRADRAPRQIKGVPVLGDTSALLGHKIMPFVDKVVIAVPSAAQSRVRQLVEKLGVLPNPVTLVIDVDGELPGKAFARISDTPLAYVSGKPNDAGRALLKRGQDLVVASLGLIVALPIMGLTALAVRLDSPGPILFKQRRHGFNNEEIVVWKFRSMKASASDATASRQVSKDDDRVTRVGRIIRKTSLDELPQIFNVLTGEMSLVGPRPHAIGMKTGDVESARLVAEYAHRHRMKPGITGWAAIHGSRGPVDTPEQVRRRVALDVEYIERQSFWLDLYIIVMTIPCLLGDSEAVR